MLTQKIRLQLSIMMFLEYFLWGAWYVTMGTYLGSGLGYEGWQISSAYGTGAIAAMVSPFIIGLIADRFFPAERVLGVLHLLGGILMYAASQIENFALFYPILLAYTLCYMPTIALTNSIAFNQMNEPDKQFPGIRVLGTLGWIIAGTTIFIWQSDISLGLNWVFPFFLTGPKVLDIEATSIPLQIASISSFVLGIYAFSLPQTPPKAKGQKTTVSDVLGLDALSLLKEKSFLIFFIASVLICIPLMFYYSFTNLFLNEIGFENAAGKMTLGQVSEMLFLLVMPLLFRRLGVKYMMIIGMLAWAARYILFAYGNPQEFVWMLYFGIILHGVSYDFFFVSGQIYADQRAPKHLRSSVQGMMTFATYGLGMFIGSLVSGPIVDMYATPDKTIPHAWQSVWLIPAVFAVIVALLFGAFFKEKSLPISEPETDSDESFSLALETK